jgi:hypothetical protein
MYVETRRGCSIEKIRPEIQKTKLDIFAFSRQEASSER